MMKNILHKYKTDVYFLCILSIIFLGIFIINFKSFVIYLYDYGREFYVPSLILDGKILYKEVFMMYPPLGYQFNALLYKIFGQSFNALFGVGVINAYFVLLSVYFIARQFVKPLFGFSIALIVLNFCLFCFNNIINYIYPYSYNLIYATSTFLLFCLLLIIYLKTNMTNDKLVCIASFVLGISFANRFEYALCIIPLLLLLIIKRKSLKFLFTNILCFLIPALFSWGILFVQGLSFSDIKDFFMFGKHLWNTPQQKLFLNVKSALLFWGTVKQLLYSIFCVFCIKKILDCTKFKKIIFLLLYVILTTGICLHARDKFYVIPFSFWTIFLVLICVYLFIKNNKDKFVYLLITVFSILISLRFSLIYGTGHYIYFSILSVIFTLVFVYNLKIKDVTKNAVCLFLIILSFQMSLNKIVCRNYKTEKIQSSKGSFYMRPQNAVVYKSLIDWIEENTDKNDKILMLPESPFINFLTDRPTNNKYFQLLPNHIEAIGEDKIVSDFKQDMPEYVMVQKMSYEPFGQPLLGEDFGFKLADFIFENYKPINFFKEDYFSVSIFQKK